MKKMFLLVSALCLVSLVSCGSDQNNNGKDDDTPKQETDEIIENRKYDDSDLLALQLSDSKLFDIKDNYFYMGEYPQTVKKDNVTIDETDVKELKYGENIAFTCYKGSDGYYYAKSQSHTYNDKEYKFHDGSTLISKTEHYYQVLPLKWRILTKDYNKDGNEGDYLVLTDRIIDSYAFTKQENYDPNTFMMTKPGVPENTSCISYEYSDLREYCTDLFYNVAFNDAQKSLIQTTTIKNDKSTTKAKDSETVVEGRDLNDKVFILSYKDCHKEEWGFDKRGSYGDAERQLYCSDMAIADGNDIWPRDDYFLGMGIWWQRSAYPKSNDQAGRNSSHGYSYFYDNAYKDNGGVAPAMVVNVTK